MKIEITRKKIIDAVSVLCLLIVFFGSFFYLKSWQKSQGDTGATTDTVQVQIGTWCTIKSNSLDGVPVYNEAGGTVNVGLFPEGKFCYLVDSEVSEGKKWAKVEYAGVSGWMRLKYLKFVSEKRLDIQKGTTIYINVSTEKGIRGYRKPDVSSEVVCEGILYGTEFKVLKIRDGWGKVEFLSHVGNADGETADTETSGDAGENNAADGQTFWINLYYAGCYPSADDVQWKVETLSSVQEINLREGPGQEEKSIGKVPEKQRLTIREFANGWGMVHYGGQDGWVKLSYLKPCKKTGNTSSENGE